MSEISRYDDVIDSRDVIERIEDLELEAGGRFIEKHPEGVSWGEVADDHSAELDDEDAAELVALRRLAEQGEELDDWADGVALVRDSYFREYAMEMADELGLLPESYQWPTSCIDWDQAARELRMDYTPVEFDGVTYWARA